VTQQLVEKLKMCLMLLKVSHLLQTTVSFHLCLHVDHESPWLFFSSSGFMTDSFQLIPSDCMQNRRQKVFNREALHWCRDAWHSNIW